MPRSPSGRASLLGGDLRFGVAAVAQLAESAPRAARLLAGLLLALALLLAVDAERGDGPRQKTAERDLLAAVFTDVDLVRVEPGQLLGDLAEQELLPVVEAHLGREDLLFHRLVDRVATDVSLVVHRVIQRVLALLGQPALLVLENGSDLGLFFRAQHDDSTLDLGNPNTAWTLVKASAPNIEPLEPIPLARPLADET